MGGFTALQRPGAPRFFDCRRRHSMVGLPAFRQAFDNRGNDGDDHRWMVDFGRGKPGCYAVAFPGKVG
mgnify:CR=1 FL=1